MSHCCIREGYGRQHIDEQGNQTESFGAIDPADHLIDTGLDITLPLDGGTLHAKIWKVEVVGVTGHIVPVYFMDTHHPKNSEYHQSMGAGSTVVMTMSESDRSTCSALAVSVYSTC